MASAMMTYRSLLPLVIVASLAIGCSQAAPAPTSVSSVTANMLAGTWTVASIQPTGQPEQPTPPSAGYTLTLADGRLSTRVDCNNCSGDFALSAQTLTVGPVLACTRAACSTMAFADAYIRLLTGESAVTLSGGILVLSSARGVVRLTR